MPLYVYQVVEPDGSDGEVFDVLQEMSEPQLTTHPESGKPVKRIFGTPSSVVRYAPGQISNQRLDRLGFTKYERTGTGTYEKTAGPGPRSIRKGD